MANMTFMQAMDTIRDARHELDELAHFCLGIVYDDQMEQDEKDKLTSQEVDRVAGIVHTQMHDLGIGAKGEESALALKAHKP